MTRSPAKAAGGFAAAEGLALRAAGGHPAHGTSLAGGWMGGVWPVGEGRGGAWSGGEGFFQFPVFWFWQEGISGRKNETLNVTGSFSPMIMTTGFEVLGH